MKTCGPFLLFLCGPVAALGSVVVERYEHVKKCSSWHEAQSHCRRCVCLFVTDPGTRRLTAQCLLGLFVEVPVVEARRALLVSKVPQTLF